MKNGGGGGGSELEHESGGLRNWWYSRTRSGWHPECCKPTVGGDERLEHKEISIMMVSGMAKTLKWWCSGAEYFCHLWKLFAPERKFRAENGVSRAAHTQYAYTVEPRYNEALGTMKFTLLYRVSHYIRVKKTKKYKELGPAKLPCYNRVLLYPTSL